MRAVIDEVTNREDWNDQAELRDTDGNLLDLSTALIVFAVRDKQTRQYVLQASTDDGNIVVTGLGTFAWAFPVETMRGVPPDRSYECGLTVRLNGTTAQIIVGTVNVIDGIVP